MIFKNSKSKNKFPVNKYITLMMILGIKAGVLILLVPYFCSKALYFLWQCGHSMTF